MINLKQKGLRIIGLALFFSLLLSGIAGVGLAQPPTTDLIITGVIDGPLSGGTPKAVEFYALNNIADLSIYGFGSANNGGGSDGEEFTFPVVAVSAGTYLYVATESVEFTNFFGFAPDYTTGSGSTAAANINGDDAIELFKNSSVVDVFGDINTDGTGEAWEYMDGWAYRVDGTGPDGTTFVLANWTFSGPNALDGETSNGTAATPFPIGSYAPPVVLPACTTDCYVDAVTGDDSNGGASPADAKKTIQAGINAVDPAGTVHVAAGTYPETLDINKALTLSGAGVGSVTVDASSFGSYSIEVTVDNVTLEGFTLLGNLAGTYGIKVAGPSPTRIANITIQDVLVDSSKRTGVDLNGVDGALIKDVEVKNVPSGNGLATTDSNDVVFENITTSSNAWGGLAIYTYGRYFSLGSDNITIQGTNSFGEANKVYVQRDNYNNPAAPEPVTNLTVNGFAYTVMNDIHRAGGENFTFYQITQADAIAFALALPNPEGSYVNEIANGHFWVGTLAGVDMSTQTAIDHASAGDTINVLPGTYEENVTVDEHVTIIGAGSGDDDTTNTILKKSANAAVVTLAASGASSVDPLLFKDLRVEPVGVYGFNVPSGSIAFVEFDNVHVVGTNPINDTEAEVGLKVATSASLTDFVIDDSAFDNLHYGWYFAKHGDWGPGGSNVSNVSVSNTSFSNNDVKGIYVEKLSDVTFDSIVVDNNGFNTTFWNATWNAGFDINLKGEETYQNITIQNSVFTDNGLGVKEGAAMMIKGRDDGATYGAHPAALNGVTVINNTISGNERGIRLGEPGKNNATPTNVMVNQNNIFGNVQTYIGVDGSAYGGVINVTQSTVDGTQNWWGDASGPSGEGPGTGDSVSTSVAFCPWLDGAYPGGSPITNGGVVTNLDTGEIFCSIKAAVEDPDTLDGHTIDVSAGTFVEDGQIVIDKNLTIGGDSAATTIVKTNQDTGSGGDARAWWLVEAGKTLDLSNLTLDGDGYKVYQAIRNKGSGSVDNVAFKNIKFNESGPHYSGVGIAAFGDGPVDVTNSEFSEMGRIGVLYFGSAVSGSSFTDNTYTGKGVGNWLDYALDISAGAIITVKGNTISGNRGVASSDSSTSAAILVTTYFYSGTEATIENNDLSDNTTAINVGFDASDTSTVVANYNNITGNDYGVTSTAPPVNGVLNWWGDASGPSGAGPGTGDSVDPEVTFCPWLDGPVPGGSPVGHSGGISLCDGAITIIKTALPADGTEFSFEGSGDIGTFVLSDTNPADGNHGTNSITISELVSDTYTIAEILPDSKWTLMSVVCTSPAWNEPLEVSLPNPPEMSFPVGWNEHVSCTFTNNRSNAVALNSFGAEAANGEVTIRWVTETELDTVGFYVMRGASADGPFSAVNDILIEAEDRTDSGDSYSYVDTTAGNGQNFYYLQELTSNETIDHYQTMTSVSVAKGFNVYLPFVIR